VQAFTVFEGLVAPLDRANVDTDAMIPKQFLKSVRRSGYGPYLFDEWRYLDHGEPGMDCTKRPVNHDFVLNQPRYQGAGILLARENFGCGSSREHAVWALVDYGFRCIIAPGFADIFYNNCFKNGILPVVLDAGIVDRLFRECEATQGYTLTVDLNARIVAGPFGETMRFDINAFRRHCLLNGLDDIALTLQESGLIRAYERKRKVEAPWLFPGDGQTR